MITTLEDKSVQKVLAELLALGITFSLDQEETNVYGVNGELLGRKKLENVIFEKNGKQFKFANRIFFRHSGISRILEKTSKKDEYYNPILISNDLFYQIYKQHIIQYLSS